MSNSPELVDIRYTVIDILNDNPELYTYHNTYLGLSTENDSPQSRLEQVINFELKRMSEYNLKRYLVIAYQKIGLSDIAEKYWDTVEV